MIKLEKAILGNGRWVIECDKQEAIIAFIKPYKHRFVLSDCYTKAGDKILFDSPFDAFLEFAEVNKELFSVKELMKTAAEYEA